MADLDVLLQDQATAEGSLPLCAVPSRGRGGQVAPETQTRAEGGRQSRGRPQPPDPASRKRVSSALGARLIYQGGRGVRSKGYLHG